MENGLLSLKCPIIIWKRERSMSFRKKAGSANSVSGKVSGNGSKVDISNRILAFSVLIAKLGQERNLRDNKKYDSRKLVFVNALVLEWTNHSLDSS